MAIDGNFSNEYLNSIKNEVFTRMDSAENGGDGNGEVSIQEALNDLNIGAMLSGQSPEDAQKLMAAASKIPDALAKYAGDDGIFNAEEWAHFLNGSEWGDVLDIWHNSSKKTEMEMGWIDNSSSSYNDSFVTKSEVKAGILNNLSANKQNVDTTQLEAVIDRYAGDDGTFTKEEYIALKKDPLYKSFIEKYNVSPFFDANNG